MIFLEENPDLKFEFDSFESIILQPEMEINFSKKETLKKSTIVSTENIDSNNYNELLVAKLEGDISEDDKEELTAFMELNPTVKLEYNLYRSTILKPDLNISYSDKESLKKKGIFLLYRTQMIYGLSIAATIIILFGVYFGFMQRPKQDIENRISNLNKVEILQPGFNVEKPAITKIPQKNNASTIVQIIPNIPETNLIESEELAMAEMQSYGIKSIDISGQKLLHKQFIETRQTASDELALSSTNNPFIVDDQKPGKSFFKRFIAGMTNKLVDVERPKNKSFLEYTIDGYNFMTDKEVEVDKEYDENGKVVAYKVNGENLSLGRANRNGTTE